MEYNKPFFEKVFSTKRMERYFNLYPDNEARAILHYRCNLELTEAFYTSLSVFEVTLRNALCRELETMTGREDWYAVFPTTPGLTRLNYYITQASKQISGRHESITPSKIVAELTFGFWVSLLNSEYERLLWKDLNTFRTFRNRVFHNESICWNLNRVEEIHQEMTTVLGWINKDVPGWLSQIDRFNTVCDKIRMAMSWKK